MTPEKADAPDDATPLPPTQLWKAAATRRWWHNPGHVRRVRFGIIGFVVAVALVLVVLGANLPPDPRVSGSSITIVTVPTTLGGTIDTAAPRVVLPGFGEALVSITVANGAVTACVLLADTEKLRDQGLMNVTDRTLGGYAGMLFVFAADSTVAFWMRSTPMPLSLAYLSQSGAVLKELDMPPCGNESTCPEYPPDTPYRMALEVPQGGLPAIGLTAGATLRIVGLRCP